MTAPTPILAYGLRIAEAEQRRADHDLGGPLFSTMPVDCAHRIVDAAADEFNALSNIACDLLAETLTDVLVQLGAAAHIVEVMVESDTAAANDPDRSVDCQRALRVLASAMRVLIEVPGVLPPELPRDDFAQWAELKFKGDLPPVRVGEAVSSPVWCCVGRGSAYR